MILTYSILCSLIALRLIAYRRDGSSYRVVQSVIAYVLIVAAGSVPLRAIMGALPVPDISTLILTAAVLAAVIGAKGNVSRFIPRRRQQPTTASHINGRFQP
ncbi:TPA: phage holin family protein [Aeromonas hydrophila]|nr:phage holin family protein [Aeromonas hydrophila subsp. hydrophila]